MDPARVLEAALALDPSERARLAKQLLTSLEPADADAERLWRDEIKKRLDELDAGTVPLEDWDVVRARLRAIRG